MRRCFERYAEDDPYYAIDLTTDKQPGVPDSDDWARAAVGSRWRTRGGGE